MVYFWQIKTACAKNKGQKDMRRIVTAVVLAVFCILSLNNKATAVQTQQQKPSGITLSPAITQASVQSSEAEHKLEFSVTNNKNTKQTINISTADFNTLDESGGLVFVGTNPTKLQKKYGLATWLTLPVSTITLEPKQSATIAANIVNQSSFAPGGHYGALLLGLDDNSNNSSGQNKVALHPIASSLLFINKVGGDTHRLKLTDVYSSHNIFKLPNTVTLRFNNNGNTHLIPRGTVEITDPNGKIVSKGIINENSGIILPETYRRYSVPLNKISGSIIPGEYKTTVNFRFDGYDTFRSYQTSQFLLTAALLLLVLAVVIIIALIFAVIFYKDQIARLQLFGNKKPSKKTK
jgi:hypothetical protein